MGETVLLIDDLRVLSSSSSSSSSFSGEFICRICHEEEFESCKNLEAPCACSGTVKYAHRDCVQRWCNEKGNTTCEICLQKFEPGYTSPLKKIQLIDATVTIRRSLDVPRNDDEEAEDENVDVETEHRSASFCRSSALIFTALLLTRHLFAVVTGEVGHYPFSLLTVLIAKASGIIVPMYILIRVLAILHTNIRLHYQNADMDSSSDDDEDEERRTSVEALV